MQMMREVTIWEYPNHDFIFAGDHAVAYRQLDTTEWQVFTHPLRIDRKGRKFVHLSEVVPNWILKLRNLPKGSIVYTVKGSKGNTYTIINGKCSCPGYTYRGNCRHAKEVEEKNND